MSRVLVWSTSQREIDLFASIDLIILHIKTEPVQQMITQKGAAVPGFKMTLKLLYQYFYCDCEVCFQSLMSLLKIRIFKI